jgi:hypothetical protein
MNDYQSAIDSFELLAILLVSHGSGGSHLLFKYPYADNTKINNNTGLCKLFFAFINLILR